MTVLMQVMASRFRKRLLQMNQQVKKLQVMNLKKKTVLVVMSQILKMVLMVVKKVVKTVLMVVKAGLTVVKAALTVVKVVLQAPIKPHLQVL